MTTRRIAIIGAGGLAREVEWLLRDINALAPRWDFAGYVVSDATRLGENDSHDGVLGDFSVFEQEGITDAVIAIGTPAARLKVAAELTRRFPRLSWPVLIHPSARIDLTSATLAPGVVLAAGVIATVNISLGAHCFVNLACTLGHEAKAEAGCVLNPTVNISGGVQLGEGVLVGTGAQVLQYLKVGAGGVVGAGAVVTRDVAPGVTVVGAPAKPRG